MHFLFFFICWEDIQERESIIQFFDPTKVNTKESRLTGLSAPFEPVIVPGINCDDGSFGAADVIMKKKNN